LYAYKSAKYVERVELTTAPVEGFWVRAGYPYLGEVPETRLREGRY
jgi:DMSO/TMAO reductase YedYZ molybdopterin-dependent catalytic subunit